ncbi:MAG: hypothetical protein ACO29M_02550, partial [Fluviibacter sp.]
MTRKATDARPRQSRLPLASQHQASTPASIIWGIAVILLAVGTYFFGLDSLQIPKNGDEFPYA